MASDMAEHKSDKVLFLSLQEVFRFLNSTPTSRNIIEGEAILRANHLFTCEISKKIEKKTGTEHHIYALCLQTSALTGLPHDITGVLLIKEDEAHVVKMECSCKAGDGQRCKHVAATLLHCNRNNIGQFTMMSCTDKKCLWSDKKSSVLAQYEPKPLLDTDCFAHLRVESNITITTEMEALFLNKLLESVPNSALAKHIQGRQQVTEERQFESHNIVLAQDATRTTRSAEMDSIIKNIFHKHNDLMDWLQELDISPQFECCKSFYEAEIVCTDPVGLCFQTYVGHGQGASKHRELWESARKFRITGSRCYPIFTYNGADWPKKAKKYFFSNPTFSTKAMKHGIAFEHVARETFSRVKGVKVVETGTIVSAKNPWIGYSPDGLVMNNGEPHSLLEIKCLAKGQHETIATAVDGCKFLVKDGENLKLREKHLYYGQVQLGMAILNLDSTDFVVFASFDQSFIHICVKKDVGFIKKMLHRLKFNYFVNMLHIVCVENK